MASPAHRKSLIHAADLIDFFFMDVPESSTHVNTTIAKVYARQKPALVGD